MSVRETAWFRAVFPLVDRPIPTALIRHRTLNRHTRSNQPITVLIPCKDERANIRACVESIRGIADEILIADSGSTDGTLELIDEIGGCRVIQREYRTSGDFKNWAIPQARHRWIFLIDADERMTPELESEIHTILQGDAPHDGYWVYRDNHFMGDPIHHCGWNHDKVLRLFSRDLSRYEGPSDHGEVVIASGRVGKLKARLKHYTYWTYDEAFEKFHRYTTLQAQQWYENGRKPSYFQMLFRAPFRFFRDYILLLGFLDGVQGLQISFLAAFYSYMKQARLWELHQSAKRSEARARALNTCDAPQVAGDSSVNEDLPNRTQSSAAVPQPKSNFQSRQLTQSEFAE